MTPDKGARHQFVVAADDFSAVARVISLLRSRQYDTVAFSAVARPTGHWLIEVTVRGDDNTAQLLGSRLDRLVDVNLSQCDC